MKKNLVGIISVVLAYGFAILFVIGINMDKSNRNSPDSQLPMNISQKYADIRLLHQYGYISKNEFESIYDQPKGNMSLEEYNSLLDQFLEGREAELMESYSKLEASQSNFGKD